MRKRIQELLHEKFEYEAEKLQLSPEKLEGKMRNGKPGRGQFSVDSPSGRLIQGFVYSTNPRVTFSPEVFIGRKETFSFTVNTAGLKNGEMLTGAFVICADSGEYTLPYCYEIEEIGREQAVKPPQMTLAQFAKIAKEDFAQAYVLFAGAGFLTLMEAWEPKCRALYEGLTVPSVNYHSLEQFLVGTAQKEPLTVSLAKEHILLRNVQENEREELLLTKNTWGFATLQISSDAPFLTIERTRVTTEEFVGSTYSIGFVIHKEKLHAGRNFARITVLTQCRSQSCIVEVQMQPALPTEKKGLRRRQETIRMMQTYIDYRAGRISVGEWSGISASCLDNIKKAGGEHIFYELYRAYLLFLSGESVEADFLLGQLTARREELVVPQWKGFYLYLTTFGNIEKDYREYVKEEINSLFLANQENWMLQWLVFQTNKSGFRNDSEKLDALRRQYICGCKSPVMYLEAWELLKKESLLMRGLEPFEIHVLAFLCREKLLDREICGQAAQIAVRQTSWNALLYEVLCRCFAQYPSKNMLTAICSLLMKGHKNSPEYANWYELGVKQDIRLAGLYEYYAQSAQDLSVKELPQAVRLYFSYQNLLGWDKKAAIYANIIRGRAKDEETFRVYRPAIELFMEEQLLEGRINEDLALIYEALLTSYVLDERMAEGLSNVLFSRQICCENPQIRHVAVLHRQLKKEQRVQFVQKKACVQEYSGDCCILLEDKEGMRYADASLYTERKLLTRPLFEDYCRAQKKVPDGILLHDCCSISDAQPVTEENAGRFIQFLRLPQLRSRCCMEAEEKLLAYYMEHPRAEYLEEYLQSVHTDKLANEHMREIMELLVSTGNCGAAWELVSKNGPEHMDVRTLVRFCSYVIRDREEQEDGTLLALCVRCYQQGIYDETVLKYLLRYYEGPVETMKALWKTGQSFFLEDYALEEKILVTVLYMRTGMEHTELIFASYMKKAGSARLAKAYAIWMSYCYFVKEMQVNSVVFEYIERKINGEMNAPKICQLALLRYYAQMDKLSAGRQKWLQYFLEKYTQQGMYFRFYQNLPGKLLRYLHLHDKYILEYRCNPAAKVTLYYRLNGKKEQAVPMDNVYEGIFVKEFTLFYQDKLEWRLKIEEGQKQKEMTGQTIICSRRFHRGSTGSYELINRMAEALQKNDERQLKEIREQYVGQQYLVDELFEIN